MAGVEAINQHGRRQGLDAPQISSIPVIYCQLAILVLPTTTGDDWPIREGYTERGNRVLEICSLVGRVKNTHAHTHTRTPHSLFISCDPCQGLKVGEPHQHYHCDAGNLTSGV